MIHLFSDISAQQSFDLFPPQWEIYHQPNKVGKKFTSYKLNEPRCSWENISEANENDSYFDTSSLHDDNVDVQVTEHEQIKADIDSKPLPKHTKKLPTVYPKHFNRPFHLNEEQVNKNYNIEADSKSDEQDFYKRKISACIRLLDGDSSVSQNPSRYSKPSIQSFNSVQSYQNSPQYSRRQ